MADSTKSVSTSSSRLSAQLKAKLAESKIRVQNLEVIKKARQKVLEAQLQVEEAIAHQELEITKAQIDAISDCGSIIVEEKETADSKCRRFVEECSHNAPVEVDYSEFLRDTTNQQNARKTNDIFQVRELPKFTTQYKGLNDMKKWVDCNPSTKKEMLDPSCKMSVQESRLPDDPHTQSNEVKNESCKKSPSTPAYVNFGQFQTESKLPDDFHTQSNEVKNESCKKSPSTPAYENLGQFHRSNPPPPPPLQPIIVKDSYSEYLAKREFIDESEKFNDKPEDYRLYKSKVSRLIDNGNLDHVECLEVLKKFTHEKSEARKLLSRISRIYIENPEAGLAQAWYEMDREFGSDEKLTNSYLEKVTKFEKLRPNDRTQLRRFFEAVEELSCAKDSGTIIGLSGLDTPLIANPIFEKLPSRLLDQWRKELFNYKQKFNIVFPPFFLFADFLRRQSAMANDSSLPTHYEESCTLDETIYVSRTEVSDCCPIHKTNHSLSKCKVFMKWELKDRRAKLKEWGRCSRCGSAAHQNCSFAFCELCNRKGRHGTALHLDNYRVKHKRNGEEEGSRNSQKTSSDHRRQQTHGEELESEEVRAKCTSVSRIHSCSKICLVKVFSKFNPKKILRCYAVFDDQSNRCLAKSELFLSLNLTVIEETPYDLKTCSGYTTRFGKRADNLIIQSIDDDVSYDLPTVIECNDIPSDRNEIPCPNVAKAFPHLLPIASQLPPVENDAEILLLIGRDAPELLKIRKSINGPRNSPFANKLDMGWTIIGDVCFSGLHKPNNETSSVYRTEIIEEDRPSVFSQCPNKFSVHDCVSSDSDCSTVFYQTHNDEKLSLSIEDNQFLAIMQEGADRTPEGNWQFPLPFKDNVLPLAFSNRSQVWKRILWLENLLNKDSTLKEKYFIFMKKLLDRNVCEPCDSEPQDGFCWYLAHFPVLHPHKDPRGVFDSKQKYRGIGLNDILLSGPDMTNSLFGILLRFRAGLIGVMADIEQMFYNFSVYPPHRDFLRFFWHKDNDPDEPLMEWKMKVHVFGNCCSPAVATFGLRKAVESSDGKPECQNFVNNDFYVDDAVTAGDDPHEVISLLQDTKNILEDSNIRLCKIVSNSKTVMEQFPTLDLGKDFQHLDLSNDELPVQRALGLSWDMNSDSLIYPTPSVQKDFTPKGALSLIHSIYDPPGMTAPVSIKGKIILRHMMDEVKRKKPGKVIGWNDPLPEKFQDKWDKWRMSLNGLEGFAIPRSYGQLPLSQYENFQLVGFSDASNEAIAACVYLRLVQKNGNVEVAFVAGKAKLTPVNQTSMPRLELCAAQLLVELMENVHSSLTSRIKLSSPLYFTDSRVALGYICNETRRFYIYVANRVLRIRKSSKPQQWFYIASSTNPADIGTRSLDASKLSDSKWINGPEFLYNEKLYPLDQGASVSVTDPEVRVAASSIQSDVRSAANLGSHRFERFSKWDSATRAIARIKRRVEVGLITDIPSGHLQKPASVHEVNNAEIILCRIAQAERFSDELLALRSNQNVQKSSPLYKSDPIISMEDGLIRIGGRLHSTQLKDELKHPIVMPNGHLLSTLLIRHYHVKTHHQGRQVTAGAVRDAGYWIIGSKRFTSSVISKCILCRKLRSPLLNQKMANLPPERVACESVAPFTYVGVDTFGHFHVAARRTRGGLAYAKRWVLCFTDFTTKGVHLELLSEMTSSSFICALRRLVSLRGNVKKLFSDRGTNFTGAFSELSELTRNDEVQDFLVRNRLDWKFNFPHSSHFGGVWERCIGSCRRILEAIMRENPTKLSDELLRTFLAEVMAIMNGRPLVPVSSDPLSPKTLTPNMLLTLKEAPLFAPIGSESMDMNDKQWRQVQGLANTFWHRYKAEYLPTLQYRSKWHQKQRELQPGDLVMIKTDDARNYWPMAIVEKCEDSASDNLVRKVVLSRTDKSRLLRPVSELVLILPVEEQLNNES